MESRVDDRVRRLMERGVVIPDPKTVSIADDVELDLIAPGVTIHPCCRISGRKTSVMAGTVIGAEAPAVIEDCQIGAGVELKGGFFKKSVFLERSSMGSGAHVREACILEEEAGGAHSVGIKHTILLPFVTLGSLVNFCDCLMAGGTSRKDHSEVGSSYIHFNYTPNQDKATASLIGDVPRGVMMGERPIFLGGRGGIVGPSIIAYGTVVAAGTIVRDDILEAGKLVLDQFPKPEVRDFHPDIYWNTKRLVRNNVIYIANLIALKAWYRLVRVQFFGQDDFGHALFRGALEKLEMAIAERISRLGAVAAKMPESIRRYSELMKGAVRPIMVAQKQELSENWKRVEDKLAFLGSSTGDDALRDDFLAEVITGCDTGLGYVKAVQGLDPAVKAKGVDWLEGIVSSVIDAVFAEIPSYRSA
ncbi:MAG TPA: UDP-N-acetylglucosamine pyrophosphorylase [Deltaproteobacteria bacterium]|jgi:UDP-N-acetylglucosamine/UDP-N-acetylgalactosamine diphosphorylase|nr:UDP-N-acetylglucosamine pyrophosphorylase [Deltaproteobacteria bacterium]HOI07578.1 UDP-N-acetylglucosamine pyrophosphorylase [Deltaproteobacteria bacterium]